MIAKRENYREQCPEKRASSKRRLKIGVINQKRNKRYSGEVMETIATATAKMKTNPNLKKQTKQDEIKSNLEKIYKKNRSNSDIKRNPS